MLTTQYLEQADRLAETIAVLDRGRVAACGSAPELKATVGSRWLAVRVADPARPPAAAVALADLAAGDEPRVAADGEIRLAIGDPAVSADAVRRLDAARVPIAAVELQQPRPRRRRQFTSRAG